MSLAFEFTPAQIQAIAEVVAEELRKRPPLPKAFFTVPEAAEILQVCEATIRRQVKAGLLPRVQGVDAIRIPAAAIERLQQLR